MLRKKRGTAVLLEQRSARALEAEIQGGRLVVTRCGRGELAEGEESSPAALGRLLARVLGAAGIRTDAATAVIPAQKVLLRRFSLPSVSPSELERMVQFQAQKALPVGEQGLKVGYFHQESPQGGVEVTAVGAPHVMLSENRAAFAEAGLSIDCATLSMIGAYNAYSCGMSEAGTPGDAVWVEIGETSSDLLVAHGGMLAFSRSLPVGEASLAEGSGPGIAEALKRGLSGSSAAADWADKLSSEINISIMNYTANNKGRAVDRVFMSGRSAGMDGLAERVGERLGMKASAPVSFPGRMDWAAREPQTALREYLALAGALWSELDRTGIRLNLEGEFFASVGRKKWRLKPILAAAAVVCSIAALFAVPGNLTERREAEIRILKAETDRLEKEETERVKGLEKKSNELRSWTRERVSWLDVLLEISNQKPFKEGQTSWGIYVTNLRFREKEPIRMNGRARTESEITSYAAQMQRSGLFKAADMTSFQKSDRKDEYPWSYEIVAMLAEAEKK